MTLLRIMVCGYGDVEEQQKAIEIANTCIPTGMFQKVYSFSLSDHDYQSYTCVRTDRVLDVTRSDYRKIKRFLIQSGFVEAKLLVPDRSEYGKEYCDVTRLNVLGDVFRFPLQESCVDVEFVEDIMCY